MLKTTTVRYVAPFDPLYDADGVQVGSGQDDRGREIPDPVPLSPPVGYRPPPTLAEMIQRMVHHAMLAQAADANDFDTFDEAEDFDIPDDPLDPQTPYEAVFNPPAAAPEKPTDAGKPKELPNEPSAVASPAVDPGPTGADPGAGTPQADPVRAS